LPTILYVFGWRFFFFSNERDEPMHVHARKGEMECKFWLDEAEFEIRPAFTSGLGPKDLRQVRQILFQHFEYIAGEWRRFREGVK
jgi:hypothetical protein